MFLLFLLEVEGFLRENSGFGYSQSPWVYPVNCGKDHSHGRQTTELVQDIEFDECHGVKSGWGLWIAMGPSGEIGRRGNQFLPGVPTSCCAMVSNPPTLLSILCAHNTRSQVNIDTAPPFGQHLLRFWLDCFPYQAFFWRIKPSGNPTRKRKTHHLRSKMFQNTVPSK